MEALYTAAEIVKLLSSLAIPLVAYLVYDFNRRINRALVVTNSWNHAQQRNLLAAQNDAVLNAIELVNTGRTGGTLTPELLRKAIYLTFIDLNRLNVLWMAHEDGIFSSGQVEDEIKSSLSSLLGSKEILEHCLKRGYSSEFQQYIQKILPEVNRKIGVVDNHDMLIEKLLKAQYVPDN